MNSASPIAPAPEFGAWAALYQRFRPTYPAAVFARLRTLVGEGGTAIELGAGSGQATLALLDQFDRIVAVEPDAEMAARIPAHPRLAVRIEAAETALFSARSAQAVIAATAFHWMDQIAVARRAAGWLAPGGVFFAFAYGKVQYPEAPRRAQALLHAHIRRARAHMDDRIASWRPYDETLKASGAFAEIENFEIYVEHRWSAEEAAGFSATTSFGQALAQSTGDADAYLRRLTDDLDAAVGGRPIVVRIPIEGAYGRTASS